MADKLHHVHPPMPKALWVGPYRISVYVFVGCWRLLETETLQIVTRLSSGAGMHIWGLSHCPNDPNGPWSIKK